MYIHSIDFKKPTSLLNPYKNFMMNTLSQWFLPSQLLLTYLALMKIDFLEHDM